MSHASDAKPVGSWADRRAGLLFVIVIDLLALFDCFALGYLERFLWGVFAPVHPTPAPPAEYLKAWALAGFILIALFHAFGLYDRRRQRAPIDVLAPLLKAGAYTMLFLLAFSYFYRGFSYSRLAVISSTIVGVLLFGMFRTAWEAYRNRLRSLGIGTKRVVLVGSRTIPRFLAQRMREDRSYGFEVVGVADTLPITGEEFADLAHAEVADLPTLLDETAAQEVLIGHPAIGQGQLLEMIESCEVRGVPIRMVPATYDLIIDSADFHEVGGIPLVTVNERRARPSHRVIKRVFDLGAGVLALIVVSPLLLASALAVRLSSQGPVFFRQQRVGRDGATFSIWKFRTMVQQAEQMLPALVDLDQMSEPVFKLEDDPRVTRVGRFLRRWSIDELPQLFNVLSGEMSLVGPRPEELNMVERYDVWERRRLKLTPGITGLQQLHSRGSRSLKERVRWDIVYLRKESFLLDLWILFRTVGVVLSGKGNH